MPELPEVETVRTGLESALAGAKITKLLLRRADLRIPFPEDLSKKLAGRTITSIARRAKYLVFTFDSNDVLIAHLGMSGRFSVVKKAPEKFSAHDHAAFYLADGRCLLYNDARRFGLMTLCKKTQLAAHPLFAHLGPEPLEKAFSSAYLKGQLAARRAPVKTTIMDQAVVVGVGNIYASEALFLAKIHPQTPACEAAKHASSLVKTIRSVLLAAIDSGGSSLRDFVHVSGEAGYFQHRFNVYGRGGEPCFACDSPLQSIRQAGRSTFFCPGCQK
jgi:formamidopyrimidine-DNA glycosylase